MLESWSHLLLKKAPEIALEVADARVLDIGRGPFGLPLRPMNGQAQNGRRQLVQPRQAHVIMTSWISPPSRPPE